MMGQHLPQRREEAVLMEEADLTSLSLTPNVSVPALPEKGGNKRYKELLAIGLTIVVLLVCMPSSSMSGRKVLDSSTPSATTLASSALQADFLYCTEPYVGNVLDNRSRLDVWYQCEGPVYNDFSYNLLKFVDQKQSERQPSWGHRPSALPAGAKVLMFGNSHTRQIGQTLACQYADNVRKVEHLEAEDSPDPNMAIKVSFDNGAQLYIVANSYVAHSPQWQRLLLAQIGVDSLDEMDAIVLGLFNPGSKHWETDFVHTMQQMEATLPATDQVNVQENYGPSVADVAAIYSGPLMFATLFGTQEPARTTWARNQVKDLALQQGRPNVVFQSARAYIQAMGQEGASTSRLETRDAADDDDKSNVQAHRCTGVHGGHVDLVAWDVAEFFFAQIPASSSSPNSSKRVQH